MSIAVAYWLLGLGGSFTKFEKVEFTTAYVTGDQTNGYIVHLNLKNTGSAAATFDPATVLYNGKPDSAYGATANYAAFAPLTLDPGVSGTGTITLETGAGFNSGMTVEITLHTTGGKDYPKVVTLP